VNTGDHYRGTWVNGKPEGHGVLTGKKNKNIRYVGEFKDGGSHGIGTFTDDLGDTYAGEWEDDRRVRSFFITALGFFQNYHKFLLYNHSQNQR
jgi:hypothetical protein